MLPTDGIHTEPNSWSAADRQPCLYPLMDPRAARHPQVSGLWVPSGIVSGLMGLATSLREAPVSGVGHVSPSPRDCDQKGIGR
jgi:hypothetical protein